MANARVVPLGNIVRQVDWELRNTGAQYKPDEIVGYCNRAMELLYQVLCEEESPLLRKGFGVMNTEEGVHEYDLAEHDMGDLWFIDKIWIPGSDPMDLTDEEDKYSYLASWEDGEIGGDSEPTQYYLTGDSTIGLLPFPDDIYKVNISYYPEWIPTDNQESPMPYRNLFNQEIIEVAKMFAKNREMTPLGIDAAMMELFQDRALQVSRKRVKREMAITVKTSQF